MKTGVRFTMVSVDFTRWQRVRVWARGVWRAVVEPPPTYWMKTVELRPGDAGYEKAPLDQYMIFGKCTYGSVPGDLERKCSEFPEAGKS